MNTCYYSLVFAIPLTIIVFILFSAWYILNRELPNSALWLAAYAFPNIIEKKMDENRQTTWQVKDTNLGEGSALLSKLATSISLLFLTLAAFTLIMFFYLLLINVSYDCDPDEKSKDCFEVFQCSNRLLKRRNPEWIGVSRVLRDCLRFQQSNRCELRCF